MQAQPSLAEAIGVCPRQFQNMEGAPGLVWASGGRPRVVFGFTIADGKIVEIEMVPDPERLRQIEVTILP